MADAFGGLAPGDQVHCLAWVGRPFTVRAVDQHRLTLVPTHGDADDDALDLTPDVAWMVTTEPRTEIWEWSDRAGERYDEVFGRFERQHPPGDLVTGYYLDVGIGGFNDGYVTPKPALAMSFKVQPTVSGFGQVRVRPVVGVDAVGGLIDGATPEAVAGWMPAGPIVPLRLGMTRYRWSLSFGEIILNWQDFLRPED